MAVVPNTNLRLIQCPLTLDNKNQITFTDKQAQANYFLSLTHTELDEISYQRKDNFIRVGDHIDNILPFNYVMYKNENYTNKWFYAFITGMEYVSDYCTNVYITTDVFQTWQFDLTFKQSFVEREMLSVSEDVPGANLLPEGLEIGELKANGTAEFDELEMIPVIAYSGETVPGLNGQGVFNIQQGGYIINGIPSSVAFILCNTTDAFNMFMRAIQEETYSQYLISCFTVPRLAVANFMNSNYQIPAYSIPGIFVLDNKNYNSNQTRTTKQLVSTPSNLDGYTPRNQKLRTYPYVYVGFNPPNGSSKIFRYEDFSEGTPKFDIISEVNPNPTVIFIPKNYRGMTGDSLQDICSLSGYPTLSSKSDYFNSWLAQNGEIINLQMEQEQFNYEIGQLQNVAGGVSSLVGNVASGNIGGAVSDVINTPLNMYSQSQNHDFYVKQQMAQIEKQKLLPDSVNLSSSNATLLGFGLQDKNIFTRYNIKAQFAERIDKFFDMYGYLTNKVKLPNTHNRPNWNYVKTIGVNIIANIPQTDLQTIKNIFDNGITLWHNTSTFLDYSQNNR